MSSETSVPTPTASVQVTFSNFTQEDQGTEKALFLFHQNYQGLKTLILQWIKSSQITAHPPSSTSLYYDGSSDMEIMQATGMPYGVVSCFPSIDPSLFTEYVTHFIKFCEFYEKFLGA